MPRRPLTASLLAALVLGLAACGGDDGDDAAATTGGGGGEVGGAEVFATAGCGGCHVLEAAGSSGTTGPNLDDARPTKEVVEAQVRSGGGLMPSFEDRLSDEEIDAVAEFVSSSAGS